ncbi:uncharacterized protein SPPG_07776 [Spizellomyces punctatus DAOM BR117]|uniref:Uncharacterized protein n=1 Tax=Spizellomyces punctatus (strain DAOM BR117) TaxID=645134 RepID=A0A0L0H7R3_SPIPD|nr:uncharacterized protein SPPG_07776 [Spizellomyces punctatus DAOM BR117]KNC96956.1 hypothetical protein SPPG_07776 [Spizellomyces punctatus DAOM BR117]|eukprot:XP_016604996.1 hypothetical protein SPPG_07776 [Spizellomyces punctatus DAOM BR117]
MPRPSSNLSLMVESIGDSLASIDTCPESPLPGPVSPRLQRCDVNAAFIAECDQDNNREQALIPQEIHVDRSINDRAAPHIRPATVEHSSFQTLSWGKCTEAWWEQSLECFPAHLDLSQLLAAPFKYQYAALAWIWLEKYEYYSWAAGYLSFDGNGPDLLMDPEVEELVERIGCRGSEQNS